METHRNKARKLGFWQEYTASDVYWYMEQNAKAVHDDLPQALPTDLDVIKYVSEHYYQQAGPNGQSVIHVIEAAGRSAPVTFDHLRQDCSMEFGISAVKNSALFNFNTEGHCPIKDAMLRVVNDVYRPNAAPLLRLSKNVYFNKWKAPAYTYNANIKVTEEMLAPWREFLERWFPEKEDERDFFERWMAVTTVRPEIYVDMAVLLRSEQGIGKNFLWDQIIRPLSGPDNCPTVSMSKMRNEFSGELYNSTAILVDEMYNNQKKAADALKSWVTDHTAFVNIKFKPQYQTDVNTNLLLTSNDRVPLYIEENDRRYWVPDFIIHKEDRFETAKWITDVMAPWLADGGLQYLRNHFEQVIRETSYSLFSSAPDTAAKEQIMARDTKPELKERLAEFLTARRTYRFYITSIQDHSEFKARLNHADIRQVLEECGFESGRPRDGEGVRTTAYRHSETYGGKRSKWPEPWSSEKERRGLIETVEPIITIEDKQTARGFSKDEQKLYEALQGHNIAPVLANADDHPTLIEWAIRENKLVNISRETSPNKSPKYKRSDGFWGNPYVEGEDGSNQEVVKKHKEWLLSGDGQHLLEHIEDLRGCVLVCNGNCTSQRVDKRCHGELLVELAAPKRDPF